MFQYSPEFFFLLSLTRQNFTFQRIDILITSYNNSSRRQTSTILHPHVVIIFGTQMNKIPMLFTILKMENKTINISFVLILYHFLNKILFIIFSDTSPKPMHLNLCSVSPSPSSLNVNPERLSTGLEVPSLFWFTITIIYITRTKVHAMKFWVKQSVPSRL